MSSQPPRPTRRDVLATAAATGLSAVLPTDAFGRPVAERPAWHKAVTGYLETLARPDGGFAWADQPESHLAPTFAAVGCYHLLKQAPADRGKIADFVRKGHPFRR